MKNLKALYIDQYGNRYHAATVKELRSKIGGGGCCVHKMYNTIKGENFHTGYVIGDHWLAKYAPVVKKA